MVVIEILFRGFPLLLVSFFHNHSIAMHLLYFFVDIYLFLVFFFHPPSIATNLLYVLRLPTASLH